MSTEQALTPASYIEHHLSFNAKSVSAGDFWTLHLDTLVMSWILGIVAFGLLWWVVRGATAGVPTKRKAFVELLVDFVDTQVKGIFHGNRHAFVAPAALTVNHPTAPPSLPNRISRPRRRGPPPSWRPVPRW